MAQAAPDAALVLFSLPERGGIASTSGGSGCTPSRGLARPGDPYTGSLKRHQSMPQRTRVIAPRNPPTDRAVPTRQKWQGSCRGGRNERRPPVHATSRAGCLRSQPTSRPFAAASDRFAAGTLARCVPSGTPSTSPWTGAAIIVQSLLTKSCIVTRPRSSNRQTPFSSEG
jgi:hypothetical protein